jgi:hypothetical protein
MIVSGIGRLVIVNLQIGIVAYVLEVISSRRSVKIVVSHVLKL